MTFCRLPHCLTYGVAVATSAGALLVFVTGAMSLAWSADGSMWLLLILLIQTPAMVMIGSPLAVPVGVFGSAMLSWRAARTKSSGWLRYEAALAGGGLGAAASTALSEIGLVMPAPFPVTAALFAVVGAGSGWLTWLLAFREVPTPAEGASSSEDGRGRVGSVVQRRVVVVALVLGAIVALPIVAIIFYLVVGIGTGYFDRLNQQEVKSYRLPTGEPLAAELERRLATHGIALPITWSTGGFGAHSISSACVEHVGRRVCLAFELGHRERKVSASNPLAASLFPELPKRVLPLGWTLDSTQSSDLSVMRRRSGDISLRSQ
jgi:hypothetical protein